MEPVAWWRKSIYPECSPCTTADDGVAQDWRDARYDVIELGRTTPIVTDEALPDPVDLLRVTWRGNREFMRPVGDYYTADQMRAYAAAAVAAAYARCAQICRDEADEWERVFAESAENCAEKIDSLTPPAA